MSSSSVIVSGLGGGLDVVNASLLFLLNDSNLLGSSRSIPFTRLLDSAQAPSSSFRVVDESTEFDIDTVSKRYAEAHVARVLRTRVLFFSRCPSSDDVVDIDSLTRQFVDAATSFNARAFVFVDGGGDSLIVRSSDASEGSEFASPFDGGDAHVLAAIERSTVLRDIPMYLAVVCAGLDIDIGAFHRNRADLSARSAYFGSINLVTGEKSADFTLSEDVLSFANLSDARNRYFEAARQLLVLSEDDKNVASKTKSHTGSVMYHALSGNHGIRRTFVAWEPRNAETGERGVTVKPEHAVMYFFDAKEVERLKIDVNKPSA